MTTPAFERALEALEKSEDVFRWQAKPLPGDPHMMVCGIDKAGIVRLVLEAIREPDEGMVRAYIGADRRRKRYAATAKRDLKAVFDHLLSER